MPLALFALVIFQIRFHAFLPRLAPDYNPPTYVFHGAGVTGVYHHAQPICKYFFLFNRFSLHLSDYLLCFAGAS
jgi:hypothetical protein